MKIGVVADTHIPGRAKNLPERIIKEFSQVDLILHAGDLTDLKILAELSALAPVEAVAGNVDSPDLQSRLGRIKIIFCEGLKIGLTHGDLGSGKTTPERAFNLFKEQEVNAVVFGHSHIPYNEYKSGRLLFNPGSPTDKRKQKLFSFGLLTLNDKLLGEIIYF